MPRRNIHAQFKYRSHDHVAYSFMLWNLREEGPDALATYEARSRDGYGSVVRMSYCGDKAYSFATPVARIVRDVEYRPVLLVSKENHSPTTQGHVGRYMSACRSGPTFVGTWDNPVIPSITVPHIAAPEGWNRSDVRCLNEAHELNLLDMLTSIELSQLTMVRQFRSDWITDKHVEQQIREADANMREYCRRFGLSEPLLDPVDMQVRRVLGERKLKLDAWLDPKAVLRRNRERARRLLKATMLNT